MEIWASEVLLLFFFFYICIILFFIKCSKATIMIVLSTMVLICQEKLNVWGVLQKYSRKMLKKNYHFDFTMKNIKYN